MEPLTDTLWITPTLVESKNGTMIIEGVFQRSDVKNANGRTYPRKIWENLVGNSQSPQQKAITERAMVGVLEHPSDGITKLTGNGGGGLSHVITNLKLEKDGTVIGRAELLDTPDGKLLQEYVKKKLKIGISSRGQGTLGTNNKVNDDYMLETFDMVHNPSTGGAHPKGVKEDAGKETKNTQTEDSEKEETQDVVNEKVKKENGKVTSKEYNQDIPFTENRKMNLGDFKLLENKARSVIAQDPAHLPDFQKNDLSNSILNLIDQLGELSESTNPAISVLATDLVSDLNEARKKASKKSQPEDFDEDDADDLDEDEVDETYGMDYDKKSKGKKKMMGGKKKKMKGKKMTYKGKKYESVEEIFDDLDDLAEENKQLALEKDSAVQLAEGLVTRLQEANDNLDEGSDGAVNESVEMLSEEVSIANNKLLTAFELIGSLTSSNSDDLSVNEAVEVFAESYENVPEGILSMLSESKTASDVFAKGKELVEFANVKEKSNSLMEDAIKNLPTGRLLESEKDIKGGEDKKIKGTINEKSNKQVLIAKAMLNG